MKQSKNKEERDNLLARIPVGAERVLVIDEKGHKKYRNILDLADNDQIQVTRMGDPIIMKSAPGRKVSTTSAPANQNVAAILARKETALKVDPLLVQTSRDPDSPDVLHAIIIGLAEESASLRFERDEASREGKDTSGLSAKRVQALRATGDIFIKRLDQLQGKSIDLDSPAFSVLFKYLMATVKEAMKTAKLRDEQVETIFSKIASMVTDEWKAEAKNRMRNS